jgi:hypothetical protein
MPTAPTPKTSRRTLLISAVVGLITVSVGSALILRDSATPTAKTSVMTTAAFDAMANANGVTITSSERQALQALLAIYSARPDLQRSFPDPLGANFDGLLSWAVTDNDVDTTSLIQYRTHLVRLRLTKFEGAQ